MASGSRMDQSTNNVTVNSGFVFVILDQYRGMERVCAPIFEMTRELDRNAPRKPIPIALYNEVCGWIEENLGAASVREVGRAVGGQIVAHMQKTKPIPHPMPRDVLEELTRAAQVGVQDQRGRGWEMRDAIEGRIIMRRTQTFNCIMQEGLLLALVEHCGVLMPRVEHRACTRHGAEFCDYEVRWLVKRSSRTIAAVGKIA
jgi:hypothetical protein